MTAWSDADLDGDPAVWGAAAPIDYAAQASGEAHGASDTEPTYTGWDPRGMIADAYAGRPISNTDWDMLCRWFDADEAAHLLTQLRAEGAGTSGPGGRDTSNDGARPGGGAGHGWKARLCYWARGRPIQEQSHPFGAVGRAILEATGF